MSTYLRQPIRLVAVFLTLVTTALTQTEPRQVARVLERPLQTPDVVNFQLSQYLLAKVPQLPQPTSAGQWSAEAKRLRERLLRDVVFHGWPREWVDAPLKVEDLGTIPSGPGYRMRKLRYEIVPGFHSTAILYEPDKMQGKVPAILNVNGHVGPPGKAVEYKQKRCINQARQGIMSLNLEWLSYGELGHAENRHWFGGHLDLVGANSLGLFYLAMRKGLDYLHQHPAVDRTRLGVTGLSGGGWQTIILSALDERVAVAVPVAGYGSLRSRLERPGDVGDIEQNATDLLAGQDYPHFTAMLAPRPSLLIYNAEDDCCFRAPLVKPYIFDEVRPFFRLFDKERSFSWHENRDPSNHNYQLDNRLQSYAFFARHFRLPDVTAEIPVDAEIKSAEELTVGLPENNLTILALAKKLPRERSGAKLADVVRYREVQVKQAWALDNLKSKGLETESYRFDFSNGLSATAVSFKAIHANATGAAIVLRDHGKKQAQAEVADRVNRGERVLAVDLLFTGDAAPGNSAAYTQMLAAVGERPLGLEAAQLVALAKWMQAPRLRLEATGIRSQAIALLAAALQPGLFQEVTIREGMPSFQHLLDAPVEYQKAPDLFCLDLYKEFDLDRLAAMASPARIVTR
ncbi:MAG: hypothetical protein WD696_01080 [Bryobacteraceae bacterium]